MFLLDTGSSETRLEPGSLGRVRPRRARESVLLGDDEGRWGVCRPTETTREAIRPLCHDPSGVDNTQLASRSPRGPGGHVGLSGRFHDLILYLSWPLLRAEIAGAQLPEKTWLHFWLISSSGVHTCKLGDMLLHTVPGSRTTPAAGKTHRCWVNCAAFGVIFTGLIPYTGCLNAAAVKHTELNIFFSLASARATDPPGLLLYCSLQTCNFYVLNNRNKPARVFFHISVRQLLCLSLLYFFVATIDVKI